VDIGFVKTGRVIKQTKAVTFYDFSVSLLKEC